MTSHGVIRDTSIQLYAI